MSKKLWLWKNFVDGRPEYWAFDNPFPVRLDDGDPQTLGEPVGYALFKPSINGRPDVTDAEVLRRIAAARTQPAQDRSDLWREGYERGMAEGAAYKEAYMKLLEQIANLQAMRPSEPIMVRTQPAQVPTLTDDEIDDLQRENNAAYHRGDVTPRRFARAIEAALLKKMQGGGV